MVIFRLRYDGQGMPIQHMDINRGHGTIDYISPTLLSTTALHCHTVPCSAVKVRWRIVRPCKKQKLSFNIQRTRPRGATHVTICTGGLRGVKLG